MKLCPSGLTWVGLLVTAILVAQGVLPVAGSNAQQAPTLGVDADPTGNEAASLGTIQSCVSVKSGQTFQVDVFITDVVDLLGWEAYFVYDPAIVNVTQRDVKLFQAANAGSSVFDTSEELPNQDASYRVSAADISDPLTPDSGSGVLARLTLVAVSAGVSPAALPLIDLTKDGRPDFGPALTDATGKSIGDADGDGLFDGQVTNAWIGVDTACPEQAPPLPTFTPFARATSTPSAQPTLTAAPPTLTPTAPAIDSGSNDGGGPPWALIGGLSGGAAVLGAGLLLWWQRRSRAGA